MFGVSLLVFEKLAILWFADAYAIGVLVLLSSAAIAVTHVG
ncbi:hypothetical protein [Streptomyces dysideae]|nr:hypothetical protein [Streptomyces dysideae]